MTGITSTIGKLWWGFCVWSCNHFFIRFLSGVQCTLLRLNRNIFSLDHDNPSAWGWRKFVTPHQLYGFYRNQWSTYIDSINLVMELGFLSALT